MAIYGIIVIFRGDYYAFKKNKLGYAAAYSVIFFILVGIFTAVLFKTQKEQIFGEGE